MSTAIEEVSSQVLAQEGGRARRLPWFSSLRFRLMLSVAIVHAVLMGAFIADAVREQSDSIRAELQSRGKALSSLMAVATTNALLAEDLASLAEVIERIRSQPDVSYGEVIDAQGKVLASTDPRRIGRRVAPHIRHSESMPLDPDDHVLDLREEIRVAGRDVGAVFVGMSTQNLRRALAASRDEGLLFILAALVVGSLAAWVLSFAITRNLHALTTAVRRITSGDLDVRVRAESRDEVGLLARTFNAMVASLQRTSRQVKLEHEKRTEAERLACVGELSASIAHEIRNPLVAIINSVNLMARGDLEGEDRTQLVEIMNLESERLQRILNDFLVFSRIPESRLREADLCRLARDTVMLLSQDPALPENLELTTAFHPERCVGRFDEDQLRQVLMNLVLNAVQAMPGGGRVTVDVAREGERLRVRVIDNGPGIPDELMDKILRPFVTGRKDGTGLGLSIVQRILMQHGSTLHVVSHKGVGTEMSFVLESA